MPYNKEMARAENTINKLKKFGSLVLHFTGADNLRTREPVFNDKLYRVLLAIHKQGVLIVTNPDILVAVIVRPADSSFSRDLRPDKNACQVLLTKIFFGIYLEKKAQPPDFMLGNQGVWDLIQEAQGREWRFQNPFFKHISYDRLTFWRESSDAWPFLHQNSVTATLGEPRRLKEMYIEFATQVEKQILSLQAIDPGVARPGNKHKTL